MATIDELQAKLDVELAKRIAGEVHSVEALEKLPARVVREAATASLRALGRAAKHEVAPVRDGLAGLGWELAWGQNLEPNYDRLSATDPKDLFDLELVAEVAEEGLAPGGDPERVVEEAAGDLARLLWARARKKVLVFGAHRDPQPASSLDAILTGFSAVIGARDPEGEYLLVALPNLAKRGGLEPGASHEVVSRILRRGKLEDARATKIAGFVE